MQGPEARRLDEHGEWLWRLHREHYERLVRMCRRALPEDRHADAEDIVQSVFADATSAWRRCPATELGPGWLIRRLRSRIVDDYRRRQREQRLVLALRSSEPTESPEDVATSQGTVRELVASIPDPDDRRALQYKLVGYREAEIAERMGVSYAGRQVRDRIRRVRRQLDAWRDRDPPAGAGE